MKKLDGTQNGYIIEDTTTDEQWQKILDGYDTVRCIIFNANTSKYFGYKPSIIPCVRNNITINNKIPDRVVYINRVV